MPQGVWEQDEIRKDDSFATFEEIFEIAHEHSVDMVLLGGDLFHDNKPSRTTLVRTMDVLSRHCLNDNPVSIEVLSRQEDNFVSGCGIGAAPFPRRCHCGFGYELP